MSQRADQRHMDDVFDITDQCLAQHQRVHHGCKVPAVRLISMLTHAGQDEQDHAECVPTWSSLIEAAVEVATEQQGRPLPAARLLGL